MRMMLFVTFPTAKFNELWRSGKIGQTIQQIIDDTKPEHIFFGKDIDGQRGAVVVVDIPSAADLSRVTEPWYLNFDAKIQTSVCMTPEEVGKIDYEDLARKYG